MNMHDTSSPVHPYNNFLNCSNKGSEFNAHCSLRHFGYFKALFKLMVCVRAVMTCAYIYMVEINNYIINSP